MFIPQYKVFLRVKHFFLIVFFYLPIAVSGQENIKKINTLRADLKAATKDTAITNIKIRLAWELKFAKSNEAWELTNDVLKKSYQQKNYYGLYKAYRLLAFKRLNLEKNPTGVIFYDSAMVYAKLLKDKAYQASTFAYKASYYGDKGDYDRSIEFYTQGLALAKQDTDLYTLRHLSNNLADAYQVQGRNTELAKENFRIARQASLKLKDYQSVSLISTNLAKEFSQYKVFDSALIELKTAYDYIKLKSDDKFLTAGTHTMFAEVYFDLKQYDSVLKYALLSKKEMEEINWPENVLQSLKKIAQVYEIRGNYTEANNYANEMLTLALKLGSKVHIRDGYKILSSVCEVNNDTKNALIYYKKYKAYDDSLFNLNREQNISNVEARTLLAKLEQEGALKKLAQYKENEALKKYNKRLKLQKYVSLLFILTLGFLAYRLYRLNRDLFRQKNIISAQAEEKDMLLKEIHHRVKNNLTFLKGMLYLQGNSSKQTETKKILKEFEYRIQSMALVHERFYDENNDNKLGLNKYLESLFCELKNGFSLKNKNLQCSINGQVSNATIAQAVPLSIMMNELATNSIKYAFEFVEHPYLEVNLFENGAQKTIEYSDNGPGLPDGITLASGGGFGFRLLKLLSEQLGGSITYVKENGKNLFRIKFKC